MTKPTPTSFYGSTMAPHHLHVLLLILRFLSIVASNESNSSQYLRGDSSPKTPPKLHRHLTSSSLWHHSFDPKTIFRKEDGMRTFDLAFRQSYGFFYDIPAADWIRSVTNVERQQDINSAPLPVGYNNEARFYYQKKWEPEFSCGLERRVGAMGDGGVWVCDPHRIEVMSGLRKTAKGRDDPCLVYSFKMDGDYSFELGLLDLFGDDLCEIHIFNLTPLSPQSTPSSSMPPQHPHLHIHNDITSLTSSHRHQPSSSPSSSTLPQILTSLSHHSRTIDILRLDCNGCEWDIYPDFISSQLVFHQILVEVHSRHEETEGFFETLRDGGYVIFHKGVSSQRISPKDRCMEYGFIKLNLAEE